VLTPNKHLNTVREWFPIMAMVPGSIFLFNLGDMEGVYGCLKVFRVVVNTLESFNFPELFKYFAQRGGVLRS